MITTDNMFELHPPSTKVRLILKPETWERDQESTFEDFTVCEDGVWRNEFGMTPAGQVTEPPSALGKHCHPCRCADQAVPPIHCRGCMCDGRPPTAGRRSHGSGW